MKKSYILSCLIAFFLSAPAFSQANAYFLNNPVWLVKTVVYPSGSDPESYEDVFNYYITGDTIISSYTYKKIFKKGTNTHYNAVGMPLGVITYINTTASFFLRSAGTSIFIRYPHQSTEQLLYDFNLAVGDTVASSDATCGEICTVVAIDSISTPYGFRKRFELDYSPSPTTVYLYEGAGSSGGIIECVGGMFLSGTNQLLCYSMDSTAYFPSGGTGCELALEVPALTKKYEASVFPNPFSSQTVFEFGKELKEASLSIFNAGGQKVKTVLFSGSSLVFERQELPAGFYYYRLQNNDKEIMTGKLVISNN